MIRNEGHRLSKLVDLLLSAAGNVLYAPAPLLWLDPRLVRDDDAQQE
jgi:hypothetical protein